MSRNAALFALMCLVWGLTWLPIKVGAQHVPPVFLAASRFVIAGALMLAWACDLAGLPRRRAWHRGIRDIGLRRPFLPFRRGSRGRAATGR